MEKSGIMREVARLLISTPGSQLDLRERNVYLLDFTVSNDETSRDAAIGASYLIYS